ncbi:hypothetical protein [Streptomyces subrutilus]|uniref:Uncharacterized protein n=1 Tax=Streptomyces subrutilus TaxID=36818 RepID=A0A5P2UXE2_9ACTN|nr:hypothetical protein [Streptomyces subrutilus]QEU82214.1 hypothetical protein CP968_31595 [Streptomyces subrutilus]WSJ28306.1 phage tail protein [Streptomyces subrutilus]GGZ92101.1 hypothetical protein GCM10010371_59810 [Streptomyces subrutilus]
MDTTTQPTQTTQPSQFRVTVAGERFTCDDAQGLGPQGDGGLPGQELTVTLTGCVLTDVPAALSWALAETVEPVHPGIDDAAEGEGEDGPQSASVRIDETDAAGRQVITAWELTGAAPAQVQGASTTASNHETRIQRLTLTAVKITPILRDEERFEAAGIAAPADRR